MNPLSLFDAFIHGLLVGSIAMSVSYIAYLLHLKFKKEPIA